VIYSLVELPECGVATEGDTITIVRKDEGDEVNGLTVGGVLSIVPRGWSDPTFGGSIDVGLSPVKDKLGIFVGLSLRLYDVASLGAGIAYQQTEELAGDLEVDQVIDSADELKTETGFKAGAYISLTVKLGQ
jgi:hypothetical protein